jgi:hypothetical protein
MDKVTQDRIDVRKLKLFLTMITMQLQSISRIAGELVPDFEEAVKMLGKLADKLEK